MKGDWIRLLPEVDVKKAEAKRAATRLTERIADLASAAASGKDYDAKFAAAVGGWSDLLNSTESLAALGQMIRQDHPAKSKYMVTGSVLELADNLLETADTMLAVSGSSAAEGPFLHALPQRKAFEAAQQLISFDFPDLKADYKSKFARLQFPTEGFESTDSGSPAAVVESADDVNARTLRILHIYDLHRTADQVATNIEILGSFETAMGTLDATDFDLIVVSGDLVQSAKKEEYRQFDELLGEIVTKFLGGEKGRCIVVPGNHDVSWDATQAGTFRVHRGEPTSEQVDTKPGIVAVQDGWLAPDAGTLTDGRAGFEAWYTAFFGRSFGGYQYVRPPGSTVGFVCLDTASGMHHLCDDARVDRDSLAKCLREAKADGGATMLVAVGHHGPVLSSNQRDGIENTVFHRLIEGGGAAYLHGHLHQSGVNYVSTDESIHFPCIGVGSLTAGPKQRGESEPRQYNVIELNLVERRGRVIVRSKGTRDKGWRKDMRFGPPAAPKDHLTFRLR